VEKYCRAGHTTDDNMAHLPCMPYTLMLQKHTLRICNSYSFSVVTVCARTRLSVPLYVHCLINGQVSLYVVSKVLDFHPNTRSTGEWHLLPGNSSNSWRHSSRPNRSQFCGSLSLYVMSNFSLFYGNVQGACLYMVTVVNCAI